MDSGWVKLYRKILDKGWLKHDHSAYIVFTWLIMIVDRQTGKYTLGRNYCREVGMKPSTFWMTLQRLVRCGAIDIKSNNRFSEVQVVKWSNYQSQRDQVDTRVDNKMTTRRQPDDTKQEERIKINTILLSKNQKETLKTDFPYLDIEYEYERFREWQKGTGKKFPNVLARFRAWLLQQRHESNKEKNVILIDPLFIQLKSCWKYNEGVGFIRKSDLQSRLGNKYPRYKFSREWEEAKNILKKEEIVF